MTLLEPVRANAFLDQYKHLLCIIAEKSLKSINEYSEARNALYKEGFYKSYVFDTLFEESFINSVKNATYGMFIFAKKYRNGYALKGRDNKWCCVYALTTPLEELIPEWCVIDTAVLPYCGFFICDGLISNRRISIGRNMIASMTQELKEERKKWSSTQALLFD
jgi:hypothetical protein